MKVKLNVKDKSVFNFLDERIQGEKENNRDGMSMGHDHSVYYLMKDEIYFKIDCDVKVGEFIKIELFDRSRHGGHELINHYTYKAEEYDDISIKMVLVDFKITNTLK